MPDTAIAPKLPPVQAQCSVCGSGTSKIEWWDCKCYGPGFSEPYCPECLSWRLSRLTCPDHGDVD